MTREEMLKLKEGDLVEVIRDGNNKVLHVKGFVYRISRVKTRKDDGLVYAETDFCVVHYIPHDTMAKTVGFLPEDVKLFDHFCQQLKAIPW